MRFSFAKLFLARAGSSISGGLPSILRCPAAPPLRERAGMFSMQIGASGSLSFDDSVTDDGIVAVRPTQPVSHLAAIQQTEESAVEEAKNFTVDCKCCQKSSDEALFFIK